MAGRIDNLFYPENRVRISLKNGRRDTVTQYSTALSLEYKKLQDRIGNLPTPEGNQELELYAITIIRDDGAIIDTFDAAIPVPLDSRDYPFSDL